MAVRTTAKAEREIPIPNEDDRWEEAMQYWDNRSDRDEARTAVDIFEEMADDYEDEPAVWAWIARGYYWLGDSVREEKERAANFTAGHKAAVKGLKIDGADVPCNFWGAACLAQASKDAGTLKRATQLPALIGMLNAVNRGRPDYFHDGLARFLAIAMAHAPGLVQQGLKALGTHVTLDGLVAQLEKRTQTVPGFVSNYLTLAEVYRGLKDMARAREWLEKGRRVDPDREPMLAPENRLDRERIERRLKEW